MLSACVSYTAPSYSDFARPDFGSSASSAVNMSGVQTGLDKLDGRLSVIEKNTRPRSQFTQLPNGTVLEITAEGKRITHTK